jgi:hypothetical protein
MFIIGYVDLSVGVTWSLLTTFNTARPQFSHKLSGHILVKYRQVLPR